MIDAEPITTHSHARWRRDVELARRFIAHAFGECRAHGVDWGAMLQATREESDLVRVANTPLSDLEDAARRFASARDDSAELAAAVHARIAAGWPAPARSGAA